jgi:magnesium transporter
MADAETWFGISFDPERRVTRPFTRDEIARELGDENVFSWIDVQGPDIGALNRVLAGLDLDLALTSHFEAPEVLPRLVERRGCVAFYLYEVEEPERHLDTSRGSTEMTFRRMVLVLGEDYCVTYHRRPLAAVDLVKRTCADNFLLAGKTPGFVVFLFLQQCLHDYVRLNLANDTFLDLLEGAVLRRDARLGHPGVATAGQNILSLKKVVASLHIVLLQLATKRSPFVSDESREAFGALLHSAEAVRAAIDSSREHLSGVVAGMQAEAAQRTSDIARVLTVISGVLLPMTIVTGVYGMNFRAMPELEQRWGYPAVLGLLLALGLGLLYTFWRMGWIGSRHRK